MKVKITKESEKPISPVLWVDDVDLTIGDGVKFGFGFGMGIFFWGLVMTISMAITVFLVGNYFLQEFKNDTLSSFGIAPNAKSVTSDPFLTNKEKNYFSELMKWIPFYRTDWK